MKKKYLSIVAAGILLLPVIMPNQLATVDAATPAPNKAPSQGQVVQEGVTDPVGIPDANLAMAIRNQLELPADAVITEGDMANLVHLKADGMNIVDLTGLEFATNLVDIDITGNQVVSLAPLTNLTNLTGISANGNQISDLSPVVGLTNLEGLSLSNNQISDISNLASLKNLTTLSLDNNQIVDLTPLAGLTKLVFLHLDNNQISDVTPLANLLDLVRLDIDNNQIADLSPLNPILSENLSVIISATNQTVRLPQQAISNGEMSAPYNIIDIRGNIVVPIIISDNGIFDLGTNTIAWSGLPVGEGEATATWVSAFRNVDFSGDFIQPYAN